MWREILVVAVMFCCSSVVAQELTDSLESQLRRVDYEQLAAEAMAQGDAKRGAVLFHLVQNQCSKCHLPDDQLTAIGPTLTGYQQPPLRKHLIQSLLEPSAVMADGYATVLIVTQDGQPLSMLLQEDRPDELVVRDVAQDGRRLVFQKRQLEDWSFSPQSMMPNGLVNQLGTKDRFLDLAKYVIEIAEGGASRAAELKPPESLTKLPPLPSYEARVDHAGLLAKVDAASFKRGERIYQRVCANCHGTHDRVGSLPTATRFATGKLRNGSDPYSLYRAITDGYGFMVAQRWMVPQQKYDVIHYLRKAYLDDNANESTLELTPDYLARLPKGDTEGPEPVRLDQYATANYGPSLIGTYEIAINNDGQNVGHNLGEEVDPETHTPRADKVFAPGAAPNMAYKGIAIRLDPGPGGIVRGSHWIVYDHNTMNVQAAWQGQGFIDFVGVQFDGRHITQPRLKGQLAFENYVGPGWAEPGTNDFEDPRPLGRDGRPFGPLPKDWLEYRGLYHYDQRVILAARVGKAEVLDHPRVISRPNDKPLFVRQLWVGPSAQSLVVRAASLDHAVTVDSKSVMVEQCDGDWVVRVPARSEPVEFRISVTNGNSLDASQWDELRSLKNWIEGGPTRWPERLSLPLTTIEQRVFGVDKLTLPSTNPWNCQVRPTGHDFFSDGRRVAMCTWDGDVWIAEGIDQREGQLLWQRIASGLYQPLGLKIVDDQVYVNCRDQIVVLRDLNGDGETDFYQCFNNDHQVTEHFHEFALGLQRDQAGNFYYARAARHAKRAVVPHHGTLLRVSSDGSRTDVLATGFRAPNGVCLNDDGTFFVTDQEGHWHPKNRINLVREGGFYGNMYSSTNVTDPSDAAMEQPMCWITNEFDRSPAELIWVPEDAWGPLGGSLLSMSYGYGRLYVVPFERVGDQLQGGLVPLPIEDAASGIMRGRFHHRANGALHERTDLYVCGMYSWAGSRQTPGCFHRIRYLDQPIDVPIAWKARKGRIELTYSDPLDAAAASDAENFAAESWDIHRTAHYGSEHHDERELQITSAQLSADGRIVTLVLPELAPTRCIALTWELKGAGGHSFEGEMHATIHQLPDTP